MQVPQREISVFTQQTDEVLLILILAILYTVPAQRVRRLVKSVGRGVVLVVPVHFSNVPSFCSFLRGECGLRRQTALDGPRCQ